MIVVGGNRHYGLELGDIVSFKVPGGHDGVKFFDKVIDNCEVISFPVTDNNGVYLLLPDGKEIRHVAEWCTKQGFNTRKHPGLNRTGTYIDVDFKRIKGNMVQLKGERALLQWHEKDGLILAQFNNFALDPLCYNWHPFLMSDFKIDPVNLEEWKDA